MTKQNLNPAWIMKVLTIKKRVIYNRCRDGITYDLAELEAIARAIRARKEEFLFHKLPNYIITAMLVGVCAWLVYIK